MSSPTATSEQVLLDARAARSCPVKTQNAFLPGAVRPERPLDAATLTRRAARSERRRQLLDRWLAAIPGSVDLRRTELNDRVAHTLAALDAGAPLVVGGALPPDPIGHRIGAPDALVRAFGRDERGSGYLPVALVGHHVVTADPPPADPPPADPPPIEAPPIDAPPMHISPTGAPDAAPNERPTQALPYGTLADPSPRRGRTLRGHRLKTGSRLGDFLKLAHEVRLLAAVGHGPRDTRTQDSGERWGGVIGTDPPTLIEGADRPEPIIGWLDLAGPVPTFGRPWPGPVPSFLEKYDQEHWFRLAVAESARRQGPDPSENPPLLVAPIVNPECGTCPWWTSCRSRLDDDDLGLRIERGRLRPLETVALRELGAGTVTALATLDPADLDQLVGRLLGRVGDRPGAENRLRTAARRARMLVAEQDFARETTGPITFPAADQEIDFDLETAADGHIYLWGFRVHHQDDGEGHAETRQFARFDDLDDEGEVELAREALGWLREQTASEQTRIYHYSGFEVAKLRELADRCDDELLRWAADYAEQAFVDLLDVTKSHFFGLSGLGLKAIARYAGFHWRDPDPGGLNSQCWFDEAVHGPASQRGAARRRVLEYNEDDVIATSRLRDWLRAQ